MFRLIKHHRSLRKENYTNMKKSVRFQGDNTIINNLYEDRKEEWMLMVGDRCRSRTRINCLSQILEPILEKRLVSYKLNYSCYV